VISGVSDGKDESTSTKLSYTINSYKDTYNTNKNAFQGANLLDSGRPDPVPGKRGGSRSGSFNTSVLTAKS
jgi:hypothetical protein